MQSNELFMLKSRNHYITGTPLTGPSQERWVFFCGFYSLSVIALENLTSKLLNLFFHVLVFLKNDYKVFVIDIAVS